MPHRFFNFLLDLLFPWSCLGCHQETANDFPLCNDCLKKISSPIINDFICPGCGKSMITGSSHSYCRTKTKLDALGYSNSYEHALLKTAIYYFKYQQIISLSKPLAQLQIAFLEQSFYFSQLPRNQIIIIPLPLHLRKQRQRGFNQSELLAQEIAQYFQLPCETQILWRIKNNPPQAQISNAAQRKANVSGIFSVKNQEQLIRKIVLLIDDVYTTGATLNEAAKILKQNGAKKVIGLVLAKG